MEQLAWVPSTGTSRLTKRIFKPRNTSDDADGSRQSRIAADWPEALAFRNVDPSGANSLPMSAGLQLQLHGDARPGVESVVGLDPTDLT